MLDYFQYRAEYQHRNANEVTRLEKEATFQNRRHCDSFCLLPMNKQKGEERPCLFHGHHQYAIEQEIGDLS